MNTQTLENKLPVDNTKIGLESYQVLMWVTKDSVQRLYGMRMGINGLVDVQGYDLPKSYSSIEMLLNDHGYFKLVSSDRKDELTRLDQLMNDYNNQKYGSIVLMYTPENQPINLQRELDTLDASQVVIGTDVNVSRYQRSYI